MWVIGYLGSDVVTAPHVYADSVDLVCEYFTRSQSHGLRSALSLLPLASSIETRFPPRKSSQ